MPGVFQRPGQALLKENARLDQDDIKRANGR
jgi:hypothetical protein